MFPLLLYLSLKQKICLLIYHTYLTSLLFSGKGSVPKSVSGKNPLKFVNFKCHCKFNVLFLIVL